MVRGLIAVAEWVILRAMALDGVQVSVYWLLQQVVVSAVAMAVLWGLVIGQALSLSVAETLTWSWQVVQSALLSQF